MGHVPVTLLASKNAIRNPSRGHEHVLAAFSCAHTLCACFGTIATESISRLLHGMDTGHQHAMSQFTIAAISSRAKHSRFITLHRQHIKQLMLRKPGTSRRFAALNALLLHGRMSMTHATDALDAGA